MMENSVITGRQAGLRGLITSFFSQPRFGWRRGLTVSAAVLVVAVFYHVIFGQNGLTAYERKLKDTHSLDAQVKSLQRENELLKGRVDRLQSDPNAIEHAAREELHYTRPGEVIYTLPPSPTSSAHSEKK